PMCRCPPPDRGRGALANGSGGAPRAVGCRPAAPGSGDGRRVPGAPPGRSTVPAEGRSRGGKGRG
ncbi:MAG: hypothetical protein ACK55I_28320, partial [bacterium]